VLVTAGLSETGRRNTSIETFFSGSDSWQVSRTPQQFGGLPLYAHLYLLADGSICYAGGHMDDGPADALRLDLTRDPASRHSMPFLTASGWRRDVRRCQAHLELGHLAGCVGHLLHGQAEPVPSKPDPLTAGPGDEFFGTPLLSGGARVVHDGSVLFGRCRLGAAPVRRWLRPVPGGPGRGKGP